MMNTWIYTLTSVMVVSMVSMIGIISLVVRKNKIDSILIILVSFSAGSLLGGAFIHLIPEATLKFGMGLKLQLLILSGIIAFFVLENFIHWRHCHIPTSDDHPRTLGLMNLVGDGFHNMLDGMVIAASFLSSTQVGIATTIAVLLHEIPQEIGDFGVLLHAGYSKFKAIFYNLMSAMLAVIGALIVLITGATEISSLLLPFTAGGFIYIAGADLIPELRKACYPLTKTFHHFIAMISGIGIMVLFVLFE